MGGLVYPARNSRGEEHEFFVSTWRNTNLTSIVYFTLKELRQAMRIYHDDVTMLRIVALNRGQGLND